MTFADIKISQIVTDGGTQSRVELSENAVAEYAAEMKEGVELPPIVVFHDGSTYWLADGFHRVMAATRASVDWLKADIRKGAKRDAILYSVGANATHGLPRTNADKRRSVMMLLQDDEWAGWADREIARRCAVGHVMVGEVRRSLFVTNSDAVIPKTYTTKHGTEATMQTGNIGRSHGFSGAKAKKTELIREFAEQGFRSSQISGKVGLDEKTVRTYANDAGIELPDRNIGKTTKIDTRRVVEQTVISLEASAQSLETIGFSFEEVTKEEAADWSQSVAESLKIFRSFHKQLSEVSRG